MPLCDKCKNPVPSNARFCSKCGSRLEKVTKPLIDKCPICNTNVEAEMIFCSKCGKNLLLVQK